MSNAVEVLKDGGWVSAEYPGDDAQVAFAIEHQRFDEAARLMCCRWLTVALEMLQEGQSPDVTTVVYQNLIAEGIAARVRNPDGEVWTPETVKAIGGKSPDALSWLEVQLFGPFASQLSEEMTQKVWGVRARSLRLIRLGLRSLARAV